MHTKAPSRGAQTKANKPLKKQTKRAMTTKKTKKATTPVSRFTRPNRLFSSQQQQQPEPIDPKAALGHWGIALEQLDSQVGKFKPLDLTSADAEDPLADESETTTYTSFYELRHEDADPEVEPLYVRHGHLKTEEGVVAFRNIWGGHPDYGTEENPVLIHAPHKRQIIGCSGPFDRRHKLELIEVNDDVLNQCPDCDTVFDLVHDMEDQQAVGYVDGMMYFYGPLHTLDKEAI